MHPAQTGHWPDGRNAAIAARLPDIHCALKPSLEQEPGVRENLSLAGRPIVNFPLRKSAAERCCSSLLASVYVCATRSNGRANLRNVGLKRQKTNNFPRQSMIGSDKVKNYLIGGMICLIAALVFGVEPVQKAINEAIHKGALKGAETCMEYSGSTLLSEEAVKAKCVSAFQKRLYQSDHATGRAGPPTGQSSVGWGGVLENRTPDHVTTWIRISVSIFDKEGAEREVFAETPIWIDPLGESEFKVDLPDLKSEQFKNIEFCENDDLTPKACMTWGVVGVKGLTI